ncbi:MerR family transcriptional regulator [Maribacter sp. 2307UL18-2]|uniref:MerR family transcriptional regulator n=1 Tax=Maribacter sp. 2307UL18-2 TaxID=3386274 RepID=UPI0039BD4860
MSENIYNSRLEISFTLEQKRFRKKDIEMSYRSLNHYDKTGLIDDDRDSNKNWRRFSGFDLIWLSIIDELRNIGVSIENLKLLKDNIFTKGNYGSIDKANFITKTFKDEIVDSIFYKYKLYLIVFEDMSYTFQDSFSEKQLANMAYKDVVSINIPLNRTILSVFKNTVMTS